MELNFNLTEQEATVMINALAKEPYNIVFEIINKLQRQANEQTQRKIVNNGFFVTDSDSDKSV